MTGVKAALKAALGKHGHGFRSGTLLKFFFLARVCMRGRDLGPFKEHLLLSLLRIDCLCCGNLKLICT